MQPNKINKKFIILFTAVLTVVIVVISSSYEAHALNQSTLKNELFNQANETLTNIEIDNDSDFFKLYTEETLISTISSDFHSTVLDDKKAFTSLQSKESNALDPYPITTKYNSINAAYSTTDMGIMYFGGTNVHLYYSISQSVVDASNSAAVLTSVFGSDPIGVPGGCSIIGDHNTQTGKFMANLGIGSKIYIKTSYGQFLYEVVKTCYGYKNVPDEMNTNDGTGIIATAKSKQFNGLILYTCYPFNSKSTNQRYFVFAKPISGTQLS